jgi:hypothetical protein
MFPCTQKSGTYKPKGGGQKKKGDSSDSQGCCKTGHTEGRRKEEETGSTFIYIWGILYLKMVRYIMPNLFLNFS